MVMENVFINKYFSVKLGPNDIMYITDGLRTFVIGAFQGSFGGVIESLRGT